MSFLVHLLDMFGYVISSDGSGRVSVRQTILLGCSNYWQRIIKLEGDTIRLNLPRLFVIFLNRRCSCTYLWRQITQCPQDDLPSYQKEMVPWMLLPRTSYMLAVEKIIPTSPRPACGVLGVHEKFLGVSSYFAYWYTIVVKQPAWLLILFRLITWFRTLLLL